MPVIATAIKALGEGPDDLGGSQGNLHIITAADLTLEEIEVMVFVEKKRKPGAESKLDIQKNKNALQIIIHTQGTYDISISDVMGKTLWKKRAKHRK